MQLGKKYIIYGIHFLEAMLIESSIMHCFHHKPYMQKGRFRKRKRIILFLRHPCGLVLNFVKLIVKFICVQNVAYIALKQILHVLYPSISFCCRGQTPYIKVHRPCHCKLNTTLAWRHNNSLTRSKYKSEHFYIRETIAIAKQRRGSSLGLASTVQDIIRTRSLCVSLIQI